MSLDALAQRLADAGPVPPHGLPLALRFADSIGALILGGRTREGRAHALAYGGTTAAGYLAAVMRLSELDDIDLRTCTTPSAVVVPVVLDAALRRGATPEAVARGLHAGYHAVARAGIAAGGIEAFTRGVWPTLVVAPLGAAAAAGVMRALPATQLAAAMRLGLMRSVGKAGATIPPLPGRWWLFGESVSAGIAAADAAAAGFTADPALDALLGDGGDVDPYTDAIADDDCGWISQKTFPTARQGANASTAFGELLREHGIDATQIAAITVEVPQPCVRVISTPIDPPNRLSVIANMGFQLGAIAFAPALLADVDRPEPFPPAVLALAKRVTIAAAADLGEHFPQQWGGRVGIEMNGGTRYERTCMTILGDPNRPLGLDEVAAKYPSLERALFDDAHAALTDAAALSRTLARLRV
jgi:2-methylcitrate dehydratase PrpD